MNDLQSPRPVQLVSVASMNRKALATVMDTSDVPFPSLINLNPKRTLTWEDAFFFHNTTLITFACPMTMTDVRLEEYQDIFEIRFLKDWVKRWGSKLLSILDFISEKLESYFNIRNVSSIERLRVYLRSLLALGTLWCDLSEVRDFPYMRSVTINDTTQKPLYNLIKYAVLGVLEMNNTKLNDALSGKMEYTVYNGIKTYVSVNDYRKYLRKQVSTNQESIEDAHGYFMTSVSITISIGIYIMLMVIIAATLNQGDRNFMPYSYNVCQHGVAGHDVSCTVINITREKK